MSFDLFYIEFGFVYIYICFLLVIDLKELSNVSLTFTNKRITMDVNLFIKNSFWLVRIHSGW